MPEWNVQVLDGGGHRVLHHDHETNESSEVGSFGPEVTLDDITALIADRADDFDYILLPDGSLLVILDVPDPESR